MEQGRWVACRSQARKSTTHTTLLNFVTRKSPTPSSTCCDPARCGCKSTPTQRLQKLERGWQRRGHAGQERWDGRAGGAPPTRSASTDVSFFFRVRASPSTSMVCVCPRASSDRVGESDGTACARQQHRTNQRTMMRSYPPQSIHPPHLPTGALCVDHHPLFLDNDRG